MAKIGTPSIFSSSPGVMSSRFGDAVQDQPDAVLAVSAVEQRLDDLLGLVQRRHFQRGHQARLVDLFHARPCAIRLRLRPRSTTVQS